MKNRVEGKIREDLLLLLLFVKIDPNEPEDEGGWKEQDAKRWESNNK